MFNKNYAFPFSQLKTVSAIFSFSAGETFHSEDHSTEMIERKVEERSAAEQNEIVSSTKQL